MSYSFFHHQDTVSYYNSRTLSYQVLKKCTVLTEIWISYVKSTGMRVNTGYINSTIGTSSNKGIMRFYVHRNQREVGGSGILYLTPTCYTVATRMTCIKVGSCVSHFNVSLIMWAKPQVFKYDNFWRESFSGLIIQSLNLVEKKLPSSHLLFSSMKRWRPSNKTTSSQLSNCVFFGVFFKHLVNQ